MEKAIKALEKYKYLVLVLFVGLVFILMPSHSPVSDASSGGAPPAATSSGEEARLETVLSDISGVGQVSVLYSERGVVVVCEGAASAQVRLDVVSAVGSYTGFGSDRISVIRMKTK